MAPARPDPERLRVWRAFLEAHAAVTRLLAADLQEQRDLPLHWYDVLVQLAEAGGRLRMQELADRVLLHKSSVTRLVDRMEADGLVERVACEADGRSRYAVLTSQGRQTLRSAAPVHLRGIQRYFAGHLTDSDVVALARAFAKLPQRWSRAEPGTLSATSILLALLKVAVAALPLVVTVAALLDAARRPEWAFAFAGRNRTTWVAVNGLGVLFCLPGVVVAAYYLLRVRPQVAAVERGRFGEP